MSFIVEAYLAETDQLLWRAREGDKGKAYRLALSADTDPRIEIRVAQVQDVGDAGPPSDEAVVVVIEPDKPVVPPRGL
jgi:hypothetical protein